MRTTVTLGPGSSLIGENNPTLRVGPQQTFIISSSYDWVTIKGFRIDGQNYGADVFTFTPYTYEVRIENCEISNVGRAFVQGAGAQVGAIYCTNDLCSNLGGPCWFFAQSTGSGLYITNCTLIEGHPGQSALYAIGYGGIYVRGFDEYDFPIPKLGGWSFALFNCYDISLDQIVLDGITTGGFLFSNCSDIQATKLNCWGVYGTGIDMIVSQRASFAACTTNYSESGSGFVMFGAQFVSVAGLQSIGNASCGIVVCNGSNNDSITGAVTQWNGAADVSVDQTCSQIVTK